MGDRLGVRLRWPGQAATSVGPSTYVLDAPRRLGCFDTPLDGPLRPRSHMIASILSATLHGVVGHAVTVEVHVGAGLPGYTIVGLPDTACRESRDRARSALMACDRPFPNGRITVNLAPSELPKAGAGFDLALAVGLLVASGEVPVPTEPLAFLGELGLDGSVRSLRGVFPMVAAIAPSGATLVVGAADAAEAALHPGVSVRAVNSLQEVIDALNGDEPWPTVIRSPPIRRNTVTPDMAEVVGQPFARHAVEVAAAGGHHLLLSGTPGSGKTLLAERLVHLLPDLGDPEAAEATSVASAAGESIGELIRRPPHRAPHHTASAVAMIGGGTKMLRPGEISRAHGGVLFLDELGEFPAAVLDALRQPLQSGIIRIDRARVGATLPARFQLVGAMNPCPCGFAGTARCACGEAQRQRYLRRISGPILDRFDIRVRVEPVAAGDLLGPRTAEPTSVVAARVAGARVRARERGVCANAHLPDAELSAALRLDPAATRLLERSIEAGVLSARGLTRVQRVALTLDDLAGGDGQGTEDLMAEAMILRNPVGRRHGAAA